MRVGPKCILHAKTDQRKPKKREHAKPVWMVLLPSGAVWADSRGSAAPAVVATPSSAVHAGGGEGGRTGFCRFK